MNTYYATNLLVYAGVDIIACLALNMQFGVSGIVNFSFIVFQAVGAYTAAVLRPDRSQHRDLPVPLRGPHRHLRRDRFRSGEPDRRVALRPHAPRDARARAGGDGHRQEPGPAQDDCFHRRRRDRRPFWRDPRRIHPALGPFGVALSGNDHPVRRCHRRRPRQQHRRHPRRPARPGGLRRGDTLHLDHDRTPGPDPRPAVGCHRPAHHRVPMVQARRCPARAAARVRRRCRARRNRLMAAAAEALVTPGRPMLVASDIHRHFEGLHAVDGVSIDVPSGQITGLIGPNGAGKSTLLAVLAGTLPASSGTIVFDGEDITSSPAYRRARRGLVRTFKLPSEFARLTVLENLLVAAPKHRGDSLFGALMGKGYWIDDERRLVHQARALLDRFGMSAQESDYAGTMSGGQKRLIEIMRALMLQPRLLLLDEPMSGVHPKIVLEIQHYLQDLRAEGLTILMVEHELHMVERLCDSVVVMAQGKVIGSGTMATLRRQREIVDAYLVG